MLDRNSGPTHSHSFLVTVELEDGKVNPDTISLKLADNLGFVEGVGSVEVDYMGSADFSDPEMKEPNVLNS